MFKKALALIMIVTGAGMVGLLSPGPVDADGHSATRSFSATTVDTGGEVTVTVEASDYGRFGQIVETLPAGFSYVHGSVSPSDVRVGVDGQNVRFGLFGEDSITYSVTASSAAGDYTFSGVVKDEDGQSEDVGGDNTITVEAGAVTPSPTEPPAPAGLRATRSISDASVTLGGEVVVTIEASDYGRFGQIVETLPAGFSYVDGSVNPSDVRVGVDGQNVRFGLFGEDSITYSVTASSAAGDYTFSGVVKDEDGQSEDVGGDNTITVEAAAPTHSATRSFSESTVEPGDEVVVTIEVAGLGGFGQVMETLPGGFTYVSSTADRATPDGQKVTFRLFGESPFTYTVTASDTEGDYAFSGVVRNEDRVEATVGGDSTVTVAVPVTPTPVTPTASPTAAPSPTTGISVTTARVRTLTAGGSSTRVNLPSIFSDMETDGLTYTAVSSRTSVVRARVSGIILRLTPGGAGTARITVTATDEDGNKERRTFTVRVRAAELPPVGDLTAPDWLLALLALAGAALLPAGILTLRSRRRRPTA